ncbi:c-type cytochrome biogenesis protein CcsB [Microlunatus sp. Gsoil 973]|jgi:cytochrome c-type biogenesis protein CcsB|uniref:c-type cytochrome biogenesis protein CcsB n=1 Tax=Microlunatus sp. Gsoil 973 TaxID=2672569 RepID=UPI0012B4576E|nr:c-type cytochrome biogenesis protein CcsB [Microlunatus sp. Gsoil 973]QGN33802.1 c-type cytochrome biogenesis protein CcsB [Microlunatus sp. Gsoil 973]
MTAQTFSSLALVTSVVIYLLAFSMHTVEWASARKIKNDQIEPVREPALVGAGGTEVGPEAPNTDSAPAVSERSAPLTPRQRSETFGRLGLSFTMIGLACAIAGVVARGIAAGRWPLGNMFEFTTMAMVIIVAAYLVLARMGMRWLGLPVTLLATVGNGLAITVFYVAVAPLVPALHSVWFIIHITAAAISGSAFNIGGLISILYLIKKRAEEKVTVGSVLGRLPDARRMDVIAYRVLAFAFPLWTFTIAAGAVWAEYAWGRYWGWDPKETWALVTWVIFACYLHARSTAGWKGTRAAMIAILGLAVFWFNFIGVNLLFAGLHSYAGI